MKIDYTLEKIYRQTDVLIFPTSDFNEALRRAVAE